MKKIHTIIALSAIAPALAQAADKSKADQRPNILLILADDLGWSDIGCYGSEVSTPNIDALAATGIRFTQFHNTSKSFPSRSCLITGLYAQQNGYAKNFRGPLENCVTLGEYLKTAGYTTLWSGKHHGSENPRTRGFDHYYGLKDGATNYFNPGRRREGEECPIQKNGFRRWCVEEQEYTPTTPYTPPEKDFYTTDYFTNYALQWLGECQGDSNPFFLLLAYNAPHDPLMAWPEDIARYDGKYKEGYEAIRKARYDKQRALGLTDSRYRLSEPTFTPWESLTAQQREVEQRKMAVYAAMIDRMDQNIGRVIDLLKRQGKYDNTLIFFVSDNGASAEVVELPESYGPIGSVSNWTSLGADWANVCNTPLRYYKNYSYQGGIATPMIVSWTRGLKNPGSKSEFPGHLIDFMATFVDLAGVPYPSEYNGRQVLPYAGVSLMPVIRGGDPARGKPLFWAWEDGCAARDGKWKIVKNGLDKPWSLYDLQADPSETVDLAAGNPKVVARLDILFDEWRKGSYSTAPN